MTTNVVVATYHGVVMGCDSLSSIVERAYFPFRTPDVLARDGEGNLLRDSQGRPMLTIDERNFQMTPTNIMGGVRKMFVLYQDKASSDIERSVAATTAGLGTLNGVVISDLADRFRRKCFAEAKIYDSAAAVVRDFIDYLRPLWEREVRFDPEKGESYYRSDDLQFIVSGYAPEDEYIKVFRVSIASGDAGEAIELFPEAPHCSAAWGGQTSSIEALINGISFSSIIPIHQAVADAMEAQRSTLVTSILEQLRQQGVNIPEQAQLDVTVDLPENLPWTQGAPQFSWANLPVQSAVDLVSTLVNAESAIQKFAMGIPTVGGRTRVGLMQRGMPFAFLNEPEVVHQHVGYNHDA